MTLAKLLAAAVAGSWSMPGEAPRAADSRMMHAPNTVGLAFYNARTYLRPSSIRLALHSAASAMHILGQPNVVDANAYAIVRHTARACFARPHIMLFFLRVPGPLAPGRWCTIPRRMVAPMVARRRPITTTPKVGSRTKACTHQSSGIASRNMAAAAQCLFAAQMGCTHTKQREGVPWQHAASCRHHRSQAQGM